MTEKTTNWTPEELAEIARVRARGNHDAWERDERGHPLMYRPAGWQGHQCPIDEHCQLCVDEAWDCAAAVMGGLLCMALAIKENAPHRYDRYLTSHCLLQRHGEACEDRYGVGACICECHGNAG